MDTKVSQIDDAQLGRVLAYEEGHFGDIKAIEIQPSKMSESVSAFANMEGGELWLGKMKTSRHTFGLGVHSHGLRTLTHTFKS